MMENKVKNILNLVENLTDSLQNYFAKNSFELLRRDQISDDETIHYILVETAEEAKVAAKDYSTIKNEIKIVCLGSIRDMKDYLLSNGRLTIDPLFAETELGEQILNKFFKESYNIHLGEGFQNLFPTPIDFKITNHLSAGLYIDEVCVNAFEKDFNIVGMRSFLDHSLYYFTYLKQAGLAGVPYEFEYTSNENFFIVNTYLPVRNFVAEYMIDSFGPVSSKDPIQYLLGVVARSTDFLEITYVDNPGRLILTAVWSKDESKKLNGIAFNNIHTTSQTLSLLDKRVREYKDVEVELEEVEEKKEIMENKNLPGGILEMVTREDENSILSKEKEKLASLIAFVIANFENEYPDRAVEEIEKHEFDLILKSYNDQEFISKLTNEDKEHILDRIRKKNIRDAYDEELQRVRGTLEDEDDFKQVLQNTMSEEVAKRVSGHLDVENINRILGSKEKPDDFVARISGMDKSKEGPFVQTISNSFSKKAGEFNVRISSSNNSEDKKELFRNLIKSVLDDAKGSNSNDLSLSVKNYIDYKMPEEIELGMEAYAKKMGKILEELSLDEMEDFQINELPKIIENVLSDDVHIEEYKLKLQEKENALLDGINPEFQEKFKLKLEKHFSELDSIVKVEDKYILTCDQINEAEVQTIIQTTMKEALDEQFQLEKASKLEIVDKEKQIIKDLSHAFAVEESSFAEIVKGGTQVAKDKEVQTVVESIFQNQVDGSTNKQITNLAEAELIKKLKQSESENKKLKLNIKSLESKIESNESAQKQINSINNEIQNQLSNEIVDVEANENINTTADINKMDHIIEQMKQGHPVDSVSIDVVSELARKEKEALLKVKDMELEIKKLGFELNQKESLFKVELAKITRQLKGKEMIVEKVKESMQTLALKKDKDISELANQIGGLNQRLANDISTKLAAQVKSLKADNEQLAKSTEMFKNRLDAFSKSKKAKAEADNSKAISDENRMLKAAKNQLENKMNSLIKEQKSLEARFTKSKDLENKYRVESSGLKAKTLDLENKIKQLKENEVRLAAMASKADTSVQKVDLSSELESVKLQNGQLQVKMKELIEKQKSSAGSSAQAGGSGSSKEKILEKDKKRLQAEIGKAKTEVETSKKEMIKMKGEQTKLKNEIIKLKKDLERSLAANKTEVTDKKAA